MEVLMLSASRLDCRLLTGLLLPSPWTVLSVHRQGGPFETNPVLSLSAQNSKKALHLTSPDHLCEISGTQPSSRVIFLHSACH